MADPKLVLFLLSDGYLEIQNLRDRQTQVLVEGGTITAVVKDSAGVAVGSVPNPVTFVEVAGSKGLYRGPIPDDASFSNGDEGTVTFTCLDSGGVKRTVTLDYEIRNGLS